MYIIALQPLIKNVFEEEEFTKPPLQSDIDITVAKCNVSVREDTH